MFLSGNLQRESGLVKEHCKGKVCVGSFICKNINSSFGIRLKDVKKYVVCKVKELESDNRMRKHYLADVALESNKFYRIF